MFSVSKAEHASSIGGQQASYLVATIITPSDTTLQQTRFVNFDKLLMKLASYISSYQILSICNNDDCVSCLHHDLRN